MEQEQTEQEQTQYLFITDAYTTETTSRLFASIEPAFNDRKSEITPTSFGLDMAILYDLKQSAQKHDVESN